MDAKITIVGGGNIGAAIAEGIVRSGKYQPQNLTLADINEQTLKLSESLGINLTTDSCEAVKNADVIFIAVKPFVISKVIESLNPFIPTDAIVVSVAAGVELEDLLSMLDHDIDRVYRIMPNIAAGIGESMSFLATNGTSDENNKKVTEIVSLFGMTQFLNEKLFDAAMVSTSCGIAYALRYIRAAMQASIEMGMTASMAKSVVAQTMKGACELIELSGSHPEVLIDTVTTPAGITISGLNELEYSGFTLAVVKGHLAAYNRVKQG